MLRRHSVLSPVEWLGPGVPAGWAGVPSTPASRWGKVLSQRHSETGLTLLLFRPWGSRHLAALCLPRARGPGLVSPVPAVGVQGHCFSAHPWAAGTRGKLKKSASKASTPFRHKKWEMRSLKLLFLPLSLWANCKVSAVFQNLLLAYTFPCMNFSIVSFYI